MTNRGATLFRVVIGVFFAGLWAYAQATGGRLSGTVTDPQAAKVPGVSIIVFNPVTGFSSK